MSRHLRWATGQAETAAEAIEAGRFEEAAARAAVSQAWALVVVGRALIDVAGCVCQAETGDDDGPLAALARVLAAEPSEAE